MLAAIQNRLTPIAERMMYLERPIEGWTAPRAGWKQFTLAGANLAPHAETMHTVFLGAPGQGKSVAIFDRLDQIRAYGQPAVIYDKKAEFIEKYYRPGHDILLSPFDKRAVSWNLWKELRYGFDSTLLAEALVELPSAGERFWCYNARILFRDLITKLADAGKTTNADLYHAAVKLPLDELAALLAGEHGGALMDPRAEKTAIGIRAELGSHMGAWSFIRDEDNSFSIREYIDNIDTTDKWVFITSRGDAHPIVKPLVSLWVELIVASILSQQSKPDRRIHLVLDEFPSLQKIPSLGQLMAEGRSFGACVDLGIQHWSQLKKTWGPDEAASMLGNAGTWCVLKATEKEGAEVMSASFGDREYREKKEQRTMSANDERDSVSFSTDKKVQKVVLPGEVLTFDRLQGVMKSPDMPHLKIRLSPKDRPTVAEGYQLRDDITWEALRKKAEKAQKVKEALENTTPEQMQASIPEELEDLEDYL